MGRGKDKVIKSSDFGNMSPREGAMVHKIIANRGILSKIKVRGTACVRAHEDGNTRYGENSTPGQYNED